MSSWFCNRHLSGFFAAFRVGRSWETVTLHCSVPIRIWQHFNGNTTVVGFFLQCKNVFSVGSSSDCFVSESQRKQSSNLELLFHSQNIHFSSNLLTYDSYCAVCYSPWNWKCDGSHSFFFSFSGLQRRPNVLCLSHNSLQTTGVVTQAFVRSIVTDASRTKKTSTTKMLHYCLTALHRFII